MILIEAIKMLENAEKQSFTFFAFLLPYIGASGLLVSGMRKSVKRSIDWYQNFLISWLAARYSTVFVYACMRVCVYACMRVCVYAGITKYITQKYDKIKTRMFIKAWNSGAVPTM